MKKTNNLLSILIFLSSCAFIILSAVLMIEYTSDKRWFRFPALMLLSGIILYFKRNRVDLSFLKYDNKDLLPLVISISIVLTDVSVFIRHYSSAVMLSGLLAISLTLAKYLLVIIGLLLGVVSLPAVFFFLKYVLNVVLKQDNVIVPYKSLVRSAAIMSLIYCAGIMTIIRADFIYKDDMQRLVSGYTCYQRENRFFAELVTRFLENDGFYADISPVTQLLEMVLMAFAAVIVYMVISGRREFRIIDYAAMIPFGLSPYFLECISFKYDAPQHGLAVFFAVFPLLFYKGNRKYFRLITMISMVCLCCSHQVPMTVYPVVVVLLCLRLWNRKEKSNKEIGILILDSAAGYISGMLFFRLFLMHDITYNLGLSRMLPFNRLIPGMIENYGNFVSNILNDYDIKWLILSLAIVLLIPLGLTISSKQTKIKALLFNSAGIAVSIALTYSLYPLLEKPLNYARHMYSFGIITGILVIAAVVLIEDNYLLISTAAKIAALGMAVMFFMFAVKYGNALSYQNDYTRFRTSMLADHLSGMEIYQKKDAVVTQIIGGTGFAQPVKAMGSNMINKLVTTSLNEYFGEWDASDIYDLYGLNAYYSSETDPDLRELNMPVYEDNYYFTIYSDGEYVLVDVKERSGTAWLEN